MCGYDSCPAAMDFHHLDPREKDFTLSEGMTSWERIRPELAKCVLLCCRCHREAHDGLHPEHIVLEDEREGGYYDEEYDEAGVLIEPEPPCLS